MEEQKVTTTEEETTSPEETKTEEKQETSESQESSSNEAIVKAVTEALTGIISAKIDGISMNLENRFVALADDIHQRLDKQDDSLSTTAAQLQSKREGVF